MSTRLGLNCAACGKPITDAAYGSSEEPDRFFDLKCFQAWELGRAYYAERRSSPAFAIGGASEPPAAGCDLNPENYILIPRKLAERMKLHLEDLLPVFGDGAPRELVGMQHDLAELLGAQPAGAPICDCGATMFTDGAVWQCPNEACRNFVRISQPNT